MSKIIEKYILKLHNRDYECLGYACTICGKAAILSDLFLKAKTHQFKMAMKGNIVNHLIHIHNIKVEKK